MNHKTITPIISVILLILLTIVASTTAYFWMMDLQEQIQQDTTSSVTGSSISDLSDFSILSTLCNSTDDYVLLTILNTGVGKIDAGTGVMVLTSTSGIQLSTTINSSLPEIPQGEAVELNFSTTYDLIDSTNYLVRLTLSNAKTRTYSCTAQD